MAEDMSFSTDALAQSADEAAVLLRALANPSRLLILCTLVEGEHSVGELERRLDMSQAYVSQQLARLRNEALVTATREGRVMRYRLSDNRIIPVLQALHDQFCSGL